MMNMKLKMKRKDFEFEQFNDDFSDFSLSSPARKIRRLNVELAPIMEEEEHPEVAMLSEERVIPWPGPASDRVGGDFAVCENQERAIVLFKPVNGRFLQASTSSPLSVTVDSNLISGFKDELFSAGRSFGGLNPVEDDDRLGKEADAPKNGSMAIIPWVPSQFLSGQTTGSKSEFMDAEAEEETAMDIEQDSNESKTEGGPQRFHENGEVIGAWHQQHCMIPQLPPMTSSPITWFH